MPEVITITKKKLADLHQRATRLAQEKSYLQLINDLICKLGNAVGLEDTIETLLRIIVETIGGTNIILYYRMDNSFHYADVYGKKQKLESVADDLVQKVINTRQYTEIEHDFKDTKLISPEFTKAWTWVFPLLVGDELIGVIKMESLHIGTRELHEQLPSFFNYAALVLKNDIQNYTNLKNAYDSLNMANITLSNEVAERKHAQAQLSKAKEELEGQRTAELRQTNDQLQLELTQRKHIEDALRESEQRWKFAIEGSNDGLWDWDIATNSVFYSEQWKKMLGYSQEDIKGRYEDWHDLIHPQDKTAFDINLEKHLLGKTPVFQNKYRVRCKDGKYKWVLVRGKVMERSPDGKALRVIGTHTDIAGIYLVPEPLKTGEFKDTIVVNGIEISWNTTKGTCVGRGLPVALMWIDTTLAGVMAGVEAMVGPERFSLALQSEGRKGTESDWMIISCYAEFRDGFEAIKQNAAVAGWGNWRLISCDYTKKECVFRVDNNWEGLYQKALNVCWGSGMLAGKFSGICSRLFETNCWATQTSFIARGDEYDEFIVAPSSLTVEDEIEKLLISDKATRADMAVALHKLKQNEISLTNEIAERKQAEEALEKSSREIYDLYNKAPCGYHSLDKDGLFIRVNETESQWLGYSQEEMLGKMNFSDLLTEASREKSYHEFPLFKSRGWIRDLEFDMIRKDGTILPVLLNATVVTDENGNYLMSRSTIYDITDRKLAQERLQQSNRMLQMLSECNQLLIRIPDEKTLLNEVCRVIADIGGYPLAWVGFAMQDEAKTVLPVAGAGEHIDYIEKMDITWTDNERGKGPTGKAIRLGKPCIVQNIQTDPDFAPWRQDAIQRGYRSSISLPLHGEGRVLGTVSIYASETDKFHEKEVELLKELAGDLAFGMIALRVREELRQSESNLRAVFNAVNETLLLMTTDGLVLATNSTGASRIGKNINEVIGKNVEILWPPETVSMRLDFAKNAIASQTPIIFEDERNKHYYRNSVYPVSPRTKEVVIFSEDITDRKLAELERESLLRNLSVKSRELESILFAASHSLRTPIVNLNGFSRELELTFDELTRILNSVSLPVPVNEEITRLVKTEVKPFLNYVVINTNTLTSLLNGIADFCRLGMAPLTIKSVNVKTIAQRAVRSVESLAKKSRAVIKIADLPPCQADSGQLQRVFVILLDNALKYFDPARPCRITISGWIDGDKSVYCVQDNGIGIKPEFWDKVFEIFHRLTPEGPALGVGLGLTLAQRIIEQHNGRIWVESEFGKGSRFCFELPK